MVFQIALKMQPLFGSVGNFSNAVFSSNIIAQGRQECKYHFYFFLSATSASFCALGRRLMAASRFNASLLPWQLSW